MEINMKMVNKMVKKTTRDTLNTGFQTDAVSGPVQLHRKDAAQQRAGLSEPTDDTTLQPDNLNNIYPPVT